MENVLERLYEIEASATAILEQTDVRKKELAIQMQKRIEEFEAQLAEKTAETIARQRQELHEKIQEDLNNEQKRMDAQVNHLKKTYQERHTEIAKAILQEIIQE